MEANDRATKDAYLIPNRLEDVIFLIQYLGFEAYSLQDGTEPDGAKPRSVKDGKWSDIGRDHPEIFRLTGKNSCVLALRYYLRNGNPNPPPIDYTKVQELLKTAMTLHERQAKRVEVWRGQFTLLIAVAGAITGIASLLLRK